MPFINDPITLKDIFRAQGITANLILDAADIASWPGSGTVWKDVSGNGYDFLLGSTGSGADAPSFVGNAGEIGAYWNHNGSQFFRLNQANPAFINGMHKASSKWTIFMLLRVPSNTQGLISRTGLANAACSLYGDTGASNSTAGAQGVYAIISGGGSISAGNTLSISNGTTTPYMGALPAVTNASTGGAPYSHVENEWEVLALSFDHGALTASILENDRVRSAVSVTANGSPSASNAAQVFEIGARGNGNLPIPNGSNIAAFAIVDGTAMTIAQMKAVSDILRGRMSSKPRNPKSLMLVANNGGTYTTTGGIAIPPAAQAGDLCIIHTDAYVNATTAPPTDAGVAGWTNLQEWVYNNAGAGGSVRERTSAKILTAGDLGTTFSELMTTTTKHNTQLALYRRADGSAVAGFANPGTPQSGAAIPTSVPAAQTIPVNGLSGSLIAWAALSSAGNGVPSANGNRMYGMSARGEVSVATGDPYSNFWVWAVQPDDVLTSDLTVEMNNVGVVGNSPNRMCSGYITVT